MGKTNVSLRGKNVLGLADFSAEEIRLVLETAKEMKNIIHRDIKKVPTLRGKSIVTLFYEPSTRTRLKRAGSAPRGVWFEGKIGRFSRVEDPARILKP